LPPEEPKDAFSPTRSRKPGIKICPRCGSIDVDATTGTGYVSPPLYVCNRCNFSGSIFPEVDVEALKEFKPSAGSEEEKADEDGESEPAGEEEEMDEDDMD